jgi:molecular chaperone GrpE
MIEQVLADFRSWLQEVPEAAEIVEPAPPPDWSTVLQHWTALRQEVNLQTKASRAQLEQTTHILEELARSASAGPAVAPQDDAGERLRPLLKALLDAHDALTLGRREALRLDAALATRADVLGAPAPEPEVVLPWWARWLGLHHGVDRALVPLRDWYRARAGADLQELKGLRHKVDAQLVGYQMGLQRLERIIEQQGLAAIDCVGLPFDPETMEVAEVVREPGRTASEVLEEVRRGYRRQGRVFRCAQVRVARPS